MGEPTARALRSAGHAVTVLSRGERPLRGGAEGAEWLRADRKDERSLAAALTGRAFDLTVDLLAYDGADVARLLDVRGFSTARYVMISTGQVYLVAAQRTPPFTEEHAGRPAMPEPEAGTRNWHNWVYGMGKRAAESELYARRERGLSALALRLPVVQGAGDPSRRLWAYLQRMLDGGPLLLPEGGAWPVRFVWSEDVARAVALLAGGAWPGVGALNLAMPDEPTLESFLRRAAACAGREPQLVDCTEQQCEAEGLDPRLSPFSGPWCSRPDPALAARELGWTGTPSEEWLPLVVRAHLDERDPEPHPEYAQRAEEWAFARRLGWRGGAGPLDQPARGNSD